MKPRLHTVLVLVSLLVVTLIVVAPTTHPKNGVWFTRESEVSYIEAVCYDVNHGLPTPRPFLLDDGRPLAFSCSVPGA
jgi:hypothetical protein